MRQIISTAIVLAIAGFGIALTPVTSASAIGTCRGFSVLFDQAGRSVDVPTTDFFTDNTSCLLSVGNREAGVKFIQTALNHCYGAGLAVDGIYGPLTRNAVAAAQRREGIAADGIYGPVTAVHLRWWDGHGCSRL